MKKTLSVILSSVMTIAALGAGTVFAEKPVTVELDGQKIDFDVNPQIIDGRTMVPLRRIFEEIGAFVKWNGDTQTVTARKNSKTITLSIDSADLQIDKGKTDDEGNPIIETVTLEVPAQILSGRTLVPARAVSESFGLSVDWDEENQKVIIVSDDKEDDSWKENEVSINLSDLTYEGEGVEIEGNLIKITVGGDYTLTGVLKNGSITVKTKEKVKLRLSGVEISTAEGPCIFVEDADKAYITLTDSAKNTLVAQNSGDGAIYSKENLEIKGNGSLEIISEGGHGIKASDNLIIEKGSITINAATDGIHINDTFKMKGGEVNITSVCDGIDSESIADISGGKIRIETNGTPIETAQTEPDATQGTGRRMMWEDEADVEFEKSTKGINAEWMLRISGGEIDVDSASHAVHCQDEIEITGGKLSLSSKYDKGISAHGNLTISGETTKIDVKKSTEGIESKNVMTIDDGLIKVFSTDDALNATGGNSGMMMPGGGFGGNAPNGERVMPEGFGRGQNAPAERQANSDGKVPGGQTEMPERGANGQNGGARPGMNFSNEELAAMFENGEFIPPFGNGESASPFENGEFTPFAGNRPQVNAGGGFPGGNMGGMGRNMKECLIINGGYLELYAEDDCVDANGNLVINSGTIKAANPTGAFSGAFGVLDADGQAKISEKASLVLAAGSGNEKSLSLSQNAIIVYCENNHAAGDEITVSDSNGNTIWEYIPQGNYKAVLIASENIQTGENYCVRVGNETFDAQISQQTTIVGTKPAGGMGFGRGQRMQ